MYIKMPVADQGVVILLSLLLGAGCNGDFSGSQDGQETKQKQEAASGSTRKEVGKASWYGAGFNGQETANGERFDSTAMTAAHPSLPMGTKAEVTNLDNGKKVEVSINDRGPVAKGRVIDVSGGAAKKLDMKKNGTATVKIETKKHQHK